MRTRFDEQLAVLNNELIQMGAMCEDAIALAAGAVTEGNLELAKKVEPLDNEIDQIERKIESMCLKLLLQQQPVAKDLRQISAALKMITDMERIGDQASDIAEIVTFLNRPAEKDCKYIKLMAEASIKMVTDSVEAYVKQDVDIANAGIEHDELVDDYFDKIKSELIDMISGNKADGEFAVDILMAAKYLERIADHAVNIAEWVLFSITGIHKGELEL